MVIDYKGFNIIIRPGDHVHVKSDRFDKWFCDGIVREIYRDSIVVMYGYKEYFGYSLSRGNTKTIQKDEITKFLRFPQAHMVRSVDESLSPEEVQGLLQGIRDE